MSILDKDTIDFLSEETKTGDIRLTISDHLDWGYPDHLLLLQEKVNSYISCIESGQLESMCPNFKSKKVIISVRFKYPPSVEAKLFLEQLGVIVNNVKINFNYKVLV